MPVLCATFDLIYRKMTKACSLILSKIDYCNSVLYGAPLGSVNTQQRVKNSVAHIVTKNSCRASSSSVLKPLHWLRVQQRIRYKLLSLITFDVRSTSNLSYLRELLRENCSTRTLHSAGAPTLLVPRTRITLADRAFSVFAPNVWNSLPPKVRNSDSLYTFKQESHQLMGQGKRRATKIRPNAVGRGISAVFRTSINADRK